MEQRARDPPDLVAGWIEDRDLVRTEQAHVEVARFGEGDSTRLRRVLVRDEREDVDELQVRRARVVDQANPVDRSLTWEFGRDGDREVQPLAAGVDAATERTPGKPE